MLIASIAGALLLVAIRAATINRQIRRRLLNAAVLLGASVFVTAALAYGRLTPPVVAELRAIQALLVALAAIVLLVAVALNPWREDRIPDRLPTIVQDAIVIALFGLAATLVLQEKILATGAVAAVVIGLAVQETLGNLVAGLAIQTEKPFHVGQWVTINGKDGLVTEITWRATKIRTKAGNFVVVPNSVLARDTITNYSEPTASTRIDLDLQVDYSFPPNEVKGAILEAIRFEPLIDRSHEPEVLVADLGTSAVVYRVRVWVADFALDDRVRDRVRSAVYYEFRRRGIGPAYPVQVYERPHIADRRTPDRTAALERMLRGVDIFAPLSDDQCAELVHSARDRLYGVGEAIVREGEPGSSVFVVFAGDVRVTAGPGAAEIARLSRGAYFGEMSLLTGEPRSATVRAVSDCELLEIDAEDFRRLVLTDAALVQRMSEAVADRQADLQRRRGVTEPAAVADAPLSLLAQIQRFFGIAG